MRPINEAPSGSSASSAPLPPHLLTRSLAQLCEESCQKNTPPSPPSPPPLIRAGSSPPPRPPSPNSPCSGSRCCSERVVPAEGRHRATSSCHDTAQRRIQVVFSNTTFPPLSATPSTPGHIAYVKYAMVAGAPGSSPSPSAALCFHVGIRPRRAPRLCRTRSMFCSCSPICPCVHGFLHGWMCITTGD